MALTPDQLRATELGRTQGLLGPDETATDGLLQSRINAAGGDAQANYTAAWGNPQSTGAALGNAVQNTTPATSVGSTLGTAVSTTNPVTASATPALNPEQQRATTLGRQLGLLKANETATGGLLQQRLEATNPDIQQLYNETWASGASKVEVGEENLVDYLSRTVQNPNLTNGTELIPILQELAADENISNDALLGAIQQVPQLNSIVAPQIQASLAQTGQVDLGSVLGSFNTSSASYDASLVGDAAAQGVAAQGEVGVESTVQGQLADLYSDFDNGNIPQWAKGAMTKAEEVMAARGLGASSLAGVAISEAIQQSALPIASQDAATYFQMDLANLDNRQQMALENTRNRQQTLLTDASLDNAAKQFNASSEQQMNQFVGSLVSQIKTTNAQLSTSVSQFNASAENQASATNAGNTLQAEFFNNQQKTAIDQFNSTLDFNRDKFNSEMQFAIEQSNVLWRRAVNTANTASVNAANQSNVMNTFNMSQVALNNLWQQWRDEASWAFSSAESQANRDYNLLQAANNRNFAQDQNSTNWASVAGSFLGSLF